ncbi:X-Pro dipeptidyl-peptidase [Coccidioides immitis RMSCC 3703]|uniref:X-Pro dipeptidyl-peptidase n=1 Tax=Coccidioides immitis RMSCC 3703 TaxID=454286 RepID=A0A0J8QSY9_COCIT|nr:X-Pro dipeptidyl-peptidase [Coccidioides immitis RMSCC 3703]
MVKRIVQHPVSICRPVVQQPIDHGESIQHRIVRVTEDIECLKRFYSIDISPTTVAKLKKYYHEELGELEALPFQSYNQEDKIDFLLLRNFLRRSLRRLELDETRTKKMDPLLRPFAPSIIQLCEDRQKVAPVDGQVAAQRLEDISKAITSLMTRLEKGDIEIDKFSAFRAASAVEQLHHSLAEWFSFYEGYEPLLTWWTSQPHSQVIVKLEDLAAAIRRNIVGLDPDEEDPIVGQPIGYEGLLADLEAEVIPYTPEELITIGEKEYIWCEREMKNASRELGFGEDWRRALEYVKNLYVSPGQQPQLVRELADEAIEYVTKNDLVTVPPLAAETWRTFMIDKLMSSLKQRPLLRATVLHELIPGHHLQLYMASRYRPYRQLFTTPFWIEGGALYWEMTFWDRGFPQSPENRIGMLFWRMHRCARIIFSLKFHMGQMTPQECIDFLVSRVGHERATAEGEVRRSFNGDYSPLYQAGYMLGALQLRSLRREIVDSGIIGEKEFHDWILRENQMPIELLRAIMQDLPLTPEYKPSWKFYG